MLYQFATKFKVKQKVIEIIKEYLSTGEAALLDQTRKLMPQLKTLELISDNEEEDQEPSIEDTQQIGSYENDSDSRKADQSRQLQRQLLKKRSSEAFDEEDNSLPEMLVDKGIKGRSGRIRKQLRLPDGFEIDV
jgi:hypothetical protein